MDERNIQRLREAVEEAKRLKKSLDRQLADLSKIIKKTKSNRVRSIARRLSC